MNLQNIVQTFINMIPGQTVSVLFFVWKIVYQLIVFTVPPYSIAYPGTLTRKIFQVN